MLSIEGRAIRKDFQGKGLGTLALSDILRLTGAQAAASVTRNPAVLALMRKAFHIVSPDLTADDPLHRVTSHKLVRHLTEVYARHVSADVRDIPFVYGRYGNGLYGTTDPGRAMRALPDIANTPGNGVIMVAVSRRHSA